MLAAWAIARRIFGAVPWWVWAAVAMLAWGGWQRHTATVATRQAEQAKAAAALHQAAAEAERQARDMEQTYRTATQEAADAYATHMRTARAAADRNRVGLDSLRSAAAAAAPACPAPSAAAPGAGTDAAAGLRAVVGQCAAALQEVAAAADAEAGRVKGLQDYIRAIGAAGPPASAPSPAP